MSSESPHNPKEVVVESVTSYYISSHDFNGISFFSLREHLHLGERELRELLGELTAEGKITLCFYSASGNPHIKRLPDPPIAEQLELLQQEDAGGICVYPSADVLLEHVGPLDVADRPYTRALLLGEAQLSPRFFELAVLERYRLDPRYDFSSATLKGNSAFLVRFTMQSNFQRKTRFYWKALNWLSLMIGIISAGLRRSFDTSAV